MVAGLVGGGGREGCVRGRWMVLVGDESGVNAIMPFVAELLGGLWGL